MGALADSIVASDGTLDDKIEGLTDGCEDSIFDGLSVRIIDGRLLNE